MQFCAAHKSRGNCMRNWGHRTARVGVSRLWVSGCSVACRSAWRSLCGASPPGQATVAHRAPRSSPRLEACPCDPVPPTPSIPAVRFGLRRGFCTFRSLSSACRRRVAPLLLQFPPFGGSEVTVRGGVTPTGKTASATNADNGGLWASCPASWWQRCLASCVTRTFTPEM